MKIIVNSRAKFAKDMFAMSSYGLNQYFEDRKSPYVTGSEIIFVQKHCNIESLVTLSTNLISLVTTVSVAIVDPFTMRVAEEFLSMRLNIISSNSTSAFVIFPSYLLSRVLQSTGGYNLDLLALLAFSGLVGIGLLGSAAVLTTPLHRIWSQFSRGRRLGLGPGPSR